MSWFTWIVGRTDSQSRNCRAIVWSEPPKFSLTTNVLLACDQNRVRLAYQHASDEESYAVVEFDGVIDWRFWPLNDEGLHSHPYAAEKLECYEFQELLESPEASSWSILDAKHWVVTFKDSTLDLIGRSVRVVDAGVDAPVARSLLNEVWEL